jgi:hypothetical protein
MVVMGLGGSSWWWCVSVVVWLRWWSRLVVVVKASGGDVDRRRQYKIWRRVTSVMEVFGGGGVSVVEVFVMVCRERI